MKQYTTQEQTDKLNELGLGNLAEYDIGELIDFLPKTIKNINGNNYLNIFFARNYWHIVYLDHKTNYDLRRTSDSELIDALYMMIVRLKEDCII